MSTEPSKLLKRAVFPPAKNLNPPPIQPPPRPKRILPNGGRPVKGTPGTWGNRF